MAVASLPIYSEDPDRDRDGTILGTSVVVYKEDGSPWACATVGTRTNSSLDQLEWEISQLNAHIVLLSAAWMRQAGQPLCGVATGFLTAIWTVFLMPGILQALIVGYMWTYAFGGTVGWPLGALCLWVGACTGAMVAHSLGNHLLGKLFSQEMRARTFLAKAENAMQATPLRLLILLRLFPLVPFNLFNYYVGATYRFKLWHNLVSLLFIFPGCIIWAGIGAAWNKYDLIQWGSAQPAQYLVSIWTGVGVTIGLMVLLSAGSCFVLRRAVKKARQRVDNGAGELEH